jgi:hypothetical protein
MIQQSCTNKRWDSVSFVDEEFNHKFVKNVVDKLLQQDLALHC